MSTLESLDFAAMEFCTGFRHPVPRGLCSWHHHTTFEVVYHPSGSGVTGIESGEEIPFHAGSVVVYPPFCEHNQLCELPGEDWCIHGQINGPLPDELSRCLVCSHVADSAVVAEAAALSDVPPTLSPLRRTAYSHRFAALLLLILETSTPAGGTGEVAAVDRYVDAACAYITEHFQSLQRMETVAEHVGISYDYLRHIFRQKMGLRLIDYVIQMRIERAKELLIHSALPLKSIAKLCGFENERYFSTSFRRLAGCTPGHLRRRG